MKDEISALRAELAALRNNTISSSILVSPNTAITSSSSSNSNNSNNNFPPAYISWDFSDTESLCSNGTDASHIGSSIPVPLKRASTLSSVVSSSLPSSSPSKQYSHHHQQQHVDLNYETFISKLKKQLKEATHSAEVRLIVSFYLITLINTTNLNYTTSSDP